MKQYRYLIHNSFLSNYYYDRFKIRLRFALLPQKVDGKWTIFSFYYSLRIISAFHFGGQIFIQYNLRQRSKSMFGFKKILKQKGIIKNYAHEKRIDFKRKESWPDWIREVMGQA